MLESRNCEPFNGQEHQPMMKIYDMVRGMASPVLANAFARELSPEQLKYRLFLRTCTLSSSMKLTVTRH